MSQSKSLLWNRVSKCGTIFIDVFDFYYFFRRVAGIKATKKQIFIFFFFFWGGGGGWFKSLGLKDAQLHSAMFCVTCPATA